MIENAIKHVDFIKGLKKKLNEETLKELLTRLSYKHTEKGEYVYKKGNVFRIH